LEKVGFILLKVIVLPVNNKYGRIILDLTNEIDVD
jgi:hypothetical protein